MPVRDSLTAGWSHNARTVRCGSHHSRVCVQQTLLCSDRLYPISRLSTSRSMSIFMRWRAFTM